VRQSGLEREDAAGRRPKVKLANGGPLGGLADLDLAHLGHLGSGRDGQVARGRVPRRDGHAVRKDLAEVVEDDHTVAEPAPPLLGMKRNGACGVTVRAVG
jgi:hypothetical protein